MALENQEKAAEFKKGDKVWLEKLVCIDGKVVWQRRQEQAVVMGQIENYAMVRFPRCMPFIESVKDLRKWNAKPAAVDVAKESH